MGSAFFGFVGTQALKQETLLCTFALIQDLLLKIFDCKSLYKISLAVLYILIFKSPEMVYEWAIKQQKFRSLGDRTRVSRAESQPGPDFFLTDYIIFTQV